MSMWMKGITGAAILAAGVATTAQADVVNHGTYNSGPGNVTFANVTETANVDTGGSGLFGAPVLSGNSILSFPLDFSATAANGSTDLKQSILSITIQAPAGQELSSVSWFQFGAYSISGANPPSTPDTFVQVDGEMDVEILTAGNGVGTQLNQTVAGLNTGVPLYDGSGNHSGSALINVSSFSATSVTFELDLSLFASAGADGESVAQINDQFNQLELQVQTASPIPVPGAATAGFAMLAGLGGLALRRKH